MCIGSQTSQVPFAALPPSPKKGGGLPQAGVGWCWLAPQNNATFTMLSTCTIYVAHFLVLHMPFGGAYMCIHVSIWVSFWSVHLFCPHL